MTDSHYTVRRISHFQLSKSDEQDRRESDLSYPLSLSPKSDGVFEISYTQPGTWLSSFQGMSDLQPLVPTLDAFTLRFSVTVNGKEGLRLSDEQALKTSFDDIEHILLRDKLINEPMNLCELATPFLLKDIKPLLGDYSSYLSLEEGLYEVETGKMKRTSLYLEHTEDHTYIDELKGARMVQSLLRTT
ncbi:hypothetical protein [Veronia pacifica]|uniref:Uncharacterized protein n=1 Tax=Veronia pacifica TaxID=1080227 RepID=A0A1C3E963_9GAMM|nr:hypothetical protein [Veronia pacifica]ODA29699.1 hypothetical protein A8L45_21985 [Veronia pacifica]